MKTPHGPRPGSQRREVARPQGRRTLGVLVAERRRPHVTQADAALAAAVHQRVAVVGVELSRRDDLRQVLHVGRLDVHDVWETRSLRKR